MRGANLEGVNLRGAYLDRAYLDGANLDGVELDRGPKWKWPTCAGQNCAGQNWTAKISRNAPHHDDGPGWIARRLLLAYLTDAGVYLQTGCFFGSSKILLKSASKTHGDNEHTQEYAAALELVACHARLWAPDAKETQPVEEAA